MNMEKKTVMEMSAALKKGESSSRALVDASLKTIDEQDAGLHAFLSVFEEDAKKDADEADERRKKGMSRGPLDGIPFAVKDNVLAKGKGCTGGSRILENYVATEDATVIRKLKDAGAVLIGKTNLDEFAMGSSTEHSAFGPTKNPHDRTRVPGGSSGGSAAAVASGMVPAAFGTDTGGSIRLPASYCGVVGLKPTYGRVSRYGLMAMASSFDQFGPLAATVEDAAVLFEHIHGQDPKDQTTVKHEAFRPHWRQSADGLRIGLPKQMWGEGIQDGVREAVMKTIEALEADGAEVKEVDIPLLDEALAVYYVLMPCEVSANMERYDGLRYGLRVNSDNLKEAYMSTRRQGFGDEARRRILLGTFALSHGYYDAYYLQAKKVQARIRLSLEEIFRDVDVLMSPTAPSVAFPIGDKTNDPLEMYLQDIFTVTANVAGVPAVSVPCGTHENLPVGLHVMGPWFDEAGILAAAKLCEKMYG